MHLHHVLMLSCYHAMYNIQYTVIDEYLESTKLEVEKTEVLLLSILGYLNLEVLPASKAL